MAREECNILDRLEGKEKRICDKGCEYFRFPHRITACVLSEVFSVRKGEECYIYEDKNKIRPRTIIKNIRRIR